MAILRPARPARQQTSKRYGLARVLSKLGLYSRSQAAKLIAAGRVCVGGAIVRDPESPTRSTDRIEVDGQAVAAMQRHYLMLNKPRGYVTTVSDERGRETVYALLDPGLPWLAPVGRLDKASEGLLLFTNDSEWAARLTDPSSHLDKTYHVQIDALADAALLARLTGGAVESGETLSAKAARVLRLGEKNSWLEIVLDEGRNRQIRRLLAAFDIEVLRLVRVAIGSLQLGELAKGKTRVLSAEEVASLRH